MTRANAFSVAFPTPDERYNPHNEREFRRAVEQALKQLGTRPALALPIVDVSDYGAIGDDTQDDRDAIDAAVLAGIAIGGAEIHFPNTATNKYYVHRLAPNVSLPVPTSDANFQPVVTSLQSHFYYLDAGRLRFTGQGITIRSDVTNGGSVFLFNGARDVTFDGVSTESVMDFNQSTAAIITVGMGGIALTSESRDSYNVTVRNYSPLHCYSGLYIFGDPSSAFRVRGVLYENVSQTGGDYGVATHDNGDQINFVNCHTNNINARAYFAYGVDGHVGDFVNEASDGYSNKFGLFLIKAYDRDTTNINITAINRQLTNTGSPTLTFQSQHNVAFQPIPKQVKNVRVHLDDHLNSTGPSVGFYYYQDAVSQPSVPYTIFDNFTLSGRVADGSTIAATVIQSIFVRGYLNMDDLVADAGGSPLMTQQGFFRTRPLSYLPELSFGGGTTGITYQALTGQIGEYYTVGNIVFCFARFILTSKGSSTGAVEVTLPLHSADYNTQVSPVIALGLNNMTGLSGSITGFVQSNSTKASLFFQHQALPAQIVGTAGAAYTATEQGLINSLLTAVNALSAGATTTTALMDTHFTDTTDLLVTFMYLI